MKKAIRAGVLGLALSAMVVTAVPTTARVIRCLVWLSQMAGQFLSKSAA